jgi:hypothetical protein
VYRCFQNENYRPHLCALCRQPYHPDRTKRLHVELKYGPRMSPRTHTEGEELVDYNADGVPRRTRLPTDLMLVVKLATALDLRPEVPAKQLRSVLKQATRWRDENVHNPSVSVSLKAYCFIYPCPALILVIGSGVEESVEICRRIQICFQSVSSARRPARSPTSSGANRNFAQCC